MRGRKPTNKRPAIIRAAEELFRTRRFHEITLEDVARSARVGKGTIYLYFKDKDQLFFDTASAGFEDLCRLVRTSVSAAAPFRRQLQEAAVRISQFFESRHQIFRMMEESRVRPDGAEFHRHRQAHRGLLIEAVAGIMRNGIAAGSVRRDLAPETLAAFFLGMLRTRAMEMPAMSPALLDYGVLIELFCTGACPGLVATATDGGAVGAPDATSRAKVAASRAGRRGTVHPKPGRVKVTRGANRL